MVVICHNCGHRKLVAMHYYCRNGLFVNKDWVYIRTPRECSEYESLAEVVVQQKILRKGW